MSDVTNTVIKAIENSRENRFEHVLIDVAKAFAFCGFFQCKNWSKIVESTFDANKLAVNTSNTEQASANEGNDALLLFNSQLAEFLQDDWNEMLPNNFIENIEAFDLNLLNDIEMELDRFEENFNELHTPHKSNTASNEIFVLPRVHVSDPQILATPANDEASPQNIPIHSGQMYLNSETNVETTALIETSTSNAEFWNEVPSEIVNQQLRMDVDVEPQNTNLMPPIRRISSAEDLLAELLSLYPDDDTLTSFTDETNRSYSQHNSDISTEKASLYDKHEQHHRCGSQNCDSQLTTKQVEQPGERVLSLPLCNQALSQHAARKNMEQLRQRLKIHSSQKSHVCDICQKAFAHCSNLSRHKLIHTGEKPFVCDVCQRAFVQSSQLSRHKLFHTGQRPYVCDVCQRGFAQSSCLFRHKMIHTGQKPHVCDVCQRAFAWPSYLAKHKLIHSGQPHACNVCQKSFHQLAALSKHQRIQHGEHFTCAHCGRSFSQKADIEFHLVQCFKEHNRRRKG